jgi:hypothetical protein
MLTAPFILLVMCLKSHVMSRQRETLVKTLTTVIEDRHKDVTIAYGNWPFCFSLMTTLSTIWDVLNYFFKLLCHLKSMSTAKMMLYMTGSVTSFFTSHQ